ncbi:MAG: hypothetical protein M2R45_04916 [Verrucomicrobia subdivision 3 bacterium]|nr:hypothetical protein [Limisphaerales bacterium]
MTDLYKHLAIARTVDLDIINNPDRVHEICDDRCLHFPGYLLPVRFSAQSIAPTCRRIQPSTIGM